MDQSASLYLKCLFLKRCLYTLLIGLIRCVSRSGWEVWSMGYRHYMEGVCEKWTGGVGAGEEIEVGGGVGV